MDILIPVNRNRFPAFFIFSLVITIFVFGRLFSGDRILWSAFGWTFFLLNLLVGVIYTIVGLLDFVKIRMDKNAALLISDSELNNNLGFLSTGKIPWTNIAAVKIRNFYGKKILVVHLYNKEGYLKNKNLVKRYFYAINNKRWGSPVIIPQNQVNYDILKLTNILRSHLN
jgi:hypothetical protein